MKRLLVAGLLLLPALAQYSDVSPNNLEWQALEALTQMGIVYGYPDGTFRPNQAIARKEVVLMLYRLWLKAREEQDKALEEAAKRLTQSIVEVSQLQAKLEDRLQALEKRVASSLTPEDKEAILAEVASLRASVNSLQDSLSVLVAQYTDLKAEQEKTRTALAAMDQRTLAWTEDSVNLQKRLNALEKALTEAEARLNQRAAEVATQTQSLLNQQVANLNQTLRGTQDQISQDIARLQEELVATRKALEETTQLLTQTREELFRLQAEVRDLRTSLTARLDRLAYTPPAFNLALTLSGFSPLILSAHIGHDNLFGLGFRIGGDYHAGTGEAMVHGGVYLPVYREPARGSLGAGIAYSFTGPYAGLTEVMAFLGFGLEVISPVEGYGELRAYFPTDGSTPRARFGLGLKVRP